jgi:hypothetical protein
MDALNDFIDAYPYAYLAVGTLVICALSARFFLTERRKYRSWLAAEKPGCGTVALARLGLLSTWAYPALMAAMIGGSVLHAYLLRTAGPDGVLAWWLQAAGRIGLADEVGRWLDMIR